MHEKNLYSEILALNAAKAAQLNQIPFIIKNFVEVLSYDSLVVIVFRMQIPTAKIDFKGVINL